MCVEGHIKNVICLAITLLLVCLVGVAYSQSTSKKPQSKTDDQIRDEMITLSIANYSGSCPCPYNTDEVVGDAEVAAPTADAVAPLRFVTEKTSPHRWLTSTVSATSSEPKCREASWRGTT